MATYMAKKEKIFIDYGECCDCGEPELAKKRSDGRMKTYGSATDTRVWATKDEDRRNYILDLIKGPRHKHHGAFGNIVPVEVMVDLLVSQKNADCKRLRHKINQLQQLLAVYESLDLTDAQRQKINQAKVGISFSEEDLNSLTTETVYSDEGATFRSEKTFPESVASYSTISTPQTSPRVHSTKTSPRSQYTQGPLSIPVSIQTTPQTSPRSCKSEHSVKIKSRPGSAKSTKSCRSQKSTKSCQSLRSARASPYDGKSVDELIALLHQRDEEISQKKSLALKAIEQLEALKALMEERDELKEKLNRYELQSSCLKSDIKEMAKHIKSKSKPTDLEKMEQEIAKLRANSTPEQETEIIKKELEMVREYCDKLSNIQSENEEFKREIEFLKSQLQGKSHVPIFSSAAAKKTIEASPSCKMLKAELRASKEKIETLEKRVASAKEDVLNSTEYKELVIKSTRFDDVQRQKENLEARLAEVGDLHTKFTTVKEKAAKADDLEREVKRLKDEINELEKYRRRSEVQSHEIRGMKEDLNSMQRQIDGLKNEKESFRCKVAEMNKYAEQCQTLICEKNSLELELEQCKGKLQESEVIRIERDSLTLKLEELATLETEFIQIVEINQLVNKEKELFRRQIHEYECVIAEQEEEIRKLVVTIDHISKHFDDQHNHFRDTLDDMRRDLHEKNSIISNSEGKLEKLDSLQQEVVEMEEHLNYTITTMSAELSEKDKTIERLSNEAMKTCKEYEKLKERCLCQENEFKKDMQEKNNLINSLKNTLCTCQSTSQDQINRLYENINEKDNTIKSLRQKCDELSETASITSQANVELEKQFADLKKLCMKSQCGKAKLSPDDEADLSKMIEEMKAKENKLLEENEALRKHCIEMQDVARQKINELSENVNLISESSSCSCTLVRNRRNRLEEKEAMKKSGFRCAKICVDLNKLEEDFHDYYDLNMEHDFTEMMMMEYFSDQFEALKRDISSFLEEIKNLLRSFDCSDVSCEFLEQIGHIIKEFENKQEERKKQEEDSLENWKDTWNELTEEFKKDKAAISSVIEDFRTLAKENMTLKGIAKELQEDKKSMDELKTKLDCVHQEKCMLEKCLCKIQQKQAILRRKQQKTPEDVEDISILKEETKSLKSAICELENCLQKAESNLIEQQASHISQQEALRGYLHDMEGCLCAKVEDIKALTNENMRLRSLMNKETPSVTCGTQSDEHRPCSTCDREIGVMERSLKDIKKENTVLKERLAKAKAEIRKRGEQGRDSSRDYSPPRVCTSIKGRAKSEDRSRGGSWTVQELLDYKRKLESDNKSLRQKLDSQVNSRSSSSREKYYQDTIKSMGENITNQKQQIEFLRREVACLKKCTEEKDSGSDLSGFDTKKLKHIIDDLREENKALRQYYVQEFGKEPDIPSRNVKSNRRPSTADDSRISIPSPTSPTRSRRPKSAMPASKSCQATTKSIKSCHAGAKKSPSDSEKELDSVDFGLNQEFEADRKSSKEKTWKETFEEQSKFGDRKEIFPAEDQRSKRKSVDFSSDEPCTTKSCESKKSLPSKTRPETTGIPPRRPSKSSHKKSSTSRRDSKRSSSDLRSSQDRSQRKSAPSRTHSLSRTEQRPSKTRAEGVPEKRRSKSTPGKSGIPISTSRTSSLDKKSKKKSSMERRSSKRLVKKPSGSSSRRTTVDQSASKPSLDQRSRGGSPNEDQSRSKISKKRSSSLDKRRSSSGTRKTRAESKSSLARSSSEVGRRKSSPKSRRSRSSSRIDTKSAKSSPGRGSQTTCRSAKSSPERGSKTTCGSAKSSPGRGSKITCGSARSSPGRGSQTTCRSTKSSPRRYSETSIRRPSKSSSRKDPDVKSKSSTRRPSKSPSSRDPNIDSKSKSSSPGRYSSETSIRRSSKSPSKRDPDSKSKSSSPGRYSESSIRRSSKSPSRKDPSSKSKSSSPGRYSETSIRRSSKSPSRRDPDSKSKSSSPGRYSRSSIRRSSKSPSRKDPEEEEEEEISIGTEQSLVKEKISGKSVTASEKKKTAKTSSKGADPFEDRDEDVESLNKKLRKCEEEKRNLNDQINTLKKKINDLEKSRFASGESDLYKKIEDLEAELKKSNQAAKMLQQENAKLKAMKGVPEGKSERVIEGDGNEKFKNILGQLEKKVSQMNQNQGDFDLEKCMEEMEKLRKENENLKDIGNDLLGNITQLEKKIKEMKENSSYLGVDDLGTNKSQPEIEKIKKEKDKLKQDYEQNYAKIRESYSREHKNMIGRHNSIIEQMQQSHETIVSQISKEYEEEISRLNKDLEGERRKKGPRGDTNEQCCQTEFKGTAVIEEYRYACPCKSGITGKLALTKKTLVLANVVPEILESPDKDGKMDSPDKIQLLRQIAILENDLTNKHQYAMEQIQSLKSTLMNEKQKLCDVQRCLDEEKRRNCVLVTKLSSQSRETTQIEIERDLLKRKTMSYDERLQQFIKNIENEKAKLKKLEEELQTEKMQNLQLKAMLENEKGKPMASKHQFSPSSVSPKMSSMAPSLNLESVCDRTNCPLSARRTKKARSPRNTQEPLYTTDLVIDNEKRRRNVIHQLKIRR